MKFRADISIVTIPASLFDKFDKDKRIDVWIDEKYDIQLGDRFEWACAQFDGIAEVTSRDSEKCIIRKIS